MKKLITPLLLIFLCGCSMTQVRDFFMGMSVEYVKNAETKYAKTFDLGAAYCYEKTLAFIHGMKAQLLNEDRKKYFLCANRFDYAYTLCLDTTQLGILITPLENGKSLVEVASGNYNLAQFVSEKLFSKLTEPEKTDTEGKR